MSYLILHFYLKLKDYQQDMMILFYLNTILDFLPFDFLGRCISRIWSSVACKRHSDPWKGLCMDASWFHECRYKVGCWQSLFEVPLWAVCCMGCWFWYLDFYFIIFVMDDNHDDFIQFICIISFTKFGYVKHLCLFWYIICIVCFIKIIVNTSLIEVVF